MFPEKSSVACVSREIVSRVCFPRNRQSRVSREIVSRVCFPEKSSIACVSREIVSRVCFPRNRHSCMCLPRNRLINYYYYYYLVLLSFEHEPSLDEPSLTFSPEVVKSHPRSPPRAQSTRRRKRKSAFSTDTPKKTLYVTSRETAKDEQARNLQNVRRDVLVLLDLLVWRLLLLRSRGNRE